MIKEWPAVPLYQGRCNIGKFTYNRSLHSILQTVYTLCSASESPVFLKIGVKRVIIDGHVHVTSRRVYAPFAFCLVLIDDGGVPMARITPAGPVTTALVFRLRCRSLQRQPAPLRDADTSRNRSWEAWPQ